MQDSNQILNEVTKEDYKYGFVTHIDTDVIHRGLDEETIRIISAKCLNPKCKGIEVKHEDKEGNVTVSYITSYDLLDDLGAEIANNIFN